MFHPLHSVSRLQNLLIPDKNDKILNIFNFLFGDNFQYSTLNNHNKEGALTTLFTEYKVKCQHLYSEPSLQKLKRKPLTTFYLSHKRLFSTLQSTRFY